MFIKEDDLKLNEWQFSQRKFLPYEIKTKLAETRIREWYDNWNGQVYLSYSGGLDSTALLHMIRKTVGKEVPAVFSNTGLEWVVETYGFPITSKENAARIRKLRHGNLCNRYRNYLLNGDERGKFGVLPKKWHYLLETKFDTSEKCCDIMKKNPFSKYGKETGRVPYVGTTQDEGFMRARLYAHTGCNVYDGKTIKSQPLGPWNRQDVLRYIDGDIRKSSSGLYYTTGEQRTGCMFCAFGAHMEECPNRFQRMAKTHPKHWKICMNLENNGVRYQDALLECKIETETWEQMGQMSIEDYLKGKIHETA